MFFFLQKWIELLCQRVLIFIGFYWMILCYFNLFAAFLLKRQRKKPDVENISTKRRYILSLVKGWVILIVSLRSVGWIWYPFSLILRKRYTSVFILNENLSRKSINKCIISTENNQNSIWFGVNLVQSRLTFLYGIY